MKRIIAIYAILVFVLSACHNESDTNNLSGLNGDDLTASLAKVKKLEYNNLEGLRNEARKLLDVNKGQLSQLYGRYYLLKADFLQSPTDSLVTEIDKVYKELKEKEQYAILAEIDILVIFHYYASREFPLASKRVQNSFDYCFRPELSLQRHALMYSLTPGGLNSTNEVGQEEILRFLKKQDANNWNFYLSRIYLGLVNSSGALGEFEKSNEYADFAIKKNIEHGLTYELIDFYSKKALLSDKLGESDSIAIGYLKKSIEMSEEFASFNRARGYRMMGHKYFTSGDYELAVKSYRNAIKFDSLTRSTSGLSVDHSYLGYALYRITKNYDEADAYFEKAIELAGADPIPLRLALERRIWILRALGREEEARKNKTRMFAADNRALQEGKNDQLQDFKINAMLMLKSRSQQVDLLESQNLLQQEQIKRQQYIRILTGLMTVLLLGLLYNFIKKVQANKELKTRQQELSIANEQLKERNVTIAEQNTQLELRKNELASELKSKLALLSNQYRINQELKQKISAQENIPLHDKKTLIKKLEGGANKRIIEEMDFQFMELHKAFCTSISSLHPNLTSNNLKLCVYLKMNLTTKEIASLTFSSPASVKVARSRLRKRLGIDSKAYSLVGYLNSVSEEEFST